MLNVIGNCFTLRLNILLTLKVTRYESRQSRFGYRFSKIKRETRLFFIFILACFTFYFTLSHNKAS